MITRQHTQEALCRAYITAVVGMAGANLHISREYDYGIDCTIMPVKGTTRRVESGFPIELQLKSSYSWSEDNEDIVYDVEAKTYNDLTEREPEAIPLYLGLLCLPVTESEWLQVDEANLTLRRCCYWWHPNGATPTSNTTTKRIRLPRRNLLDTSQVLKLLADARPSGQTA